MEKRNILLFCEAGMSTSIMVKKMTESCEKHNMPFEISAHMITKAVDLVEKMDPVLVLLGPQVKFLESKMRKQLAKYDVPIDVIDTALYGAMDGEEVMKQVVRILKEHKASKE